MKAEAFFEGICAADRHEGGIRCLRLLRFDATLLRQLRQEVEQVCRERTPSVATRHEHVTSWTHPFGMVLQYSLLNATGRFDDYSMDHHQTSVGKRFQWAREYPALGALIAALPDTINVRINVLGPGSGLPAHEEQLLVRAHDGTVGARLRFHLPIRTNRASELVLDGAVYHLAAGSVYFVNHGCVHSAVNRGTSQRIHLVWDMRLTRAVFDSMFGVDETTFAAHRVVEERRMVAPLKHQRVGAYARLPAQVSLSDARLLDFCEPG